MGLSDALPCVCGLHGVLAWVGIPCAGRLGGEDATCEEGGGAEQGGALATHDWLRATLGVMTFFPGGHQMTEAQWLPARALVLPMLAGPSTLTQGA